MIMLCSGFCSSVFLSLNVAHNTVWVVFDWECCLSLTVYVITDWQLGWCRFCIGNCNILVGMELLFIMISMVVWGAVHDVIVAGRTVLKVDIIVVDVGTSRVVAMTVNLLEFWLSWDSKPKLLLYLMMIVASCLLLLLACKFIIIYDWTWTKLMKTTSVVKVRGNNVPPYHKTLTNFLCK